MFVDKFVTVTYFHKSAEVYQTLSAGVMGAFHRGNALLEEGILTEFDQKKDVGKFKSALNEYEGMAKQMNKLAKKLDELMEIDKSGKKVAVYEEALRGIIREDKPFERVSNVGTRYALAAGDKTGQIDAISGSADILRAQRADLQVLQRKLDVVLDALRSAIPLAERSEFVPVMLSGRNAFGDVMPQFTDMMSAYDRFYARSCMATIAATMQAYPAGFEWLSKTPIK